MNFLRRVGNALARFMYGRNGVDHLNIALVWLCILIEIASSFAARRWALAGTALYYASLALWAWILFRTFSKNLGKRRAENQRWLNIWWRIKGKGGGAWARHTDKEHKYFTCKGCGAVCRVPAGQGNIVITCPKCGAQIRARS